MTAVIEPGFPIRYQRGSGMALIALDEAGTAWVAVDARLAMEIAEAGEPVEIELDGWQLVTVEAA